MDPFGLIGVIGLAGQVLSSVVQLGLDMKDAPSDARNFVRQLQTLKTALSETNTNLLLNHDFQEAFRGRHSTVLSQLQSTTELTDTQRMVSACVDELGALIKSLTKRSHHKINWERIKSAFLAQKTKDAVDNLERQCRILNSLVAIDAVALNARTYNEVRHIRAEQQETQGSVEKIHDRLDSQVAVAKRKAILEWLSPVNYASQHHDFISKRQPGTGTWLLESHEYHAWLTGDQGTFFCPGIPGAGKTFLTATLIDHLLTTHEADTNIGIGFIYCNFQRQETQKAEDLLAALLKQLCQKIDFIPNVLDALYNECCSNDKSRPPFAGISKCLRSVASEYSKVFVLIDALDECHEFERKKFLTELRSLQESSAINVFATSRFIPDILNHFSGCSTLEIRASRDDVETYLDQNMSKLKTFVQRNAKLQEDIKISISTAVDGMFLLARTYLDMMVDMFTVKAIKKALANIQQQTQSTGDEHKVKTLHAAYSDAMDRINRQQPGSKELALQVLAWVTFAKRPLTVLELRNALAVEVGEPEFDEDNIPDLDDIVSICAGLVTIDEASTIIRLTHYTAQEYLQQTKNQWFPDVEAEIALVCVSYLNMDNFEPCPDEDIQQRLEDYPLYGYASHNWGYHACGSMESYDGILDFLQDNTKVVAAAQAMHEVSKRDVFKSSSEAEGSTGVHLAAWFGIIEVLDLPWASSLLEAEDSNHTTPMLWAAENGQHEVVKRLLEKGIDPNYKDQTGVTALKAAAVNDHSKTIEVILASGKVQADAYDNDQSSQTPLSIAAEYGYENVVRVLFKAGADIESTNSTCTTPLFLAAREGHEAVVKMLLATGRVNVNASGKEGETALYVAAQNGHTSIVKLLLQRGATTSWRLRHQGGSFKKEPTSIGKMINGRPVSGGFVHEDVTALHNAVRRGHEPVVSLLLEHGVPINQLFVETSIEQKRKYSRDPENGALLRYLSQEMTVVKKTALSIAIEKGYASIIQLLKDKGGTELDTQEEINLLPDSLKFDDKGATYVEVIGEENVKRTVSYLE